MSKLLDLGNPVFSSYVLWSSVLVLKMLAMSLLTAVHRFKNQVSIISTIHIRFLIEFFLEIICQGGDGAIFNVDMNSHFIITSIRSCNSADPAHAHRCEFC